MKILHLSAVKNWGGGGNHIENLFHELSKTNPGVKNMLVVAEGGQFHSRLKNSNFNFETLPLRFKVDPRAIFKLIRLCKRERFDLIHIHGSVSLTLATIANKIYSLPPFVFSKKTSFPIKTRKRTLYKYNHPKIKKILCVSKATEAITRKAILDVTKLHTIYHGTRIDNKSQKTPFLIREKFNIPPNHKIVGSIGNHIKAKDLPTWLETIDFIINIKKITNISFIQLGSFSKMTPFIKEEIAKKGLHNYIHFLGYTPQASNFMEQFDVFLVTSKSEGLPQVIYEAFYHKTPVVSTNVGGIPEIIDHNYNGLLSEKEDSSSLGNNVLKLLNNPELAEELSKRSFDKLMPTFTSENMAKETLRIYQEIV